MPEFNEVGGQGVPRRVVLRGVGGLLPGLVLAGVGAGRAAAADAGDGPRSRTTVRGAFSLAGYSWPAVASTAQVGAEASGVVFTLTAGGRPLSGRRVRFSISGFHAAGRSLWFEVPGTAARAARLGYLDLDVDRDGVVALDPWLRRGVVPSAAVGVRPELRAQLVGSETILSSVPVTVL